MLGLLAMGTHGYLKMYYDMSDFGWIPIASLSFVIFVAAIGVLPLTFVMLSEILPLKVRLNVTSTIFGHFDKKFFIDHPQRWHENMLFKICGCMTQYLKSDVVPPYGGILI